MRNIKNMRIKTNTAIDLVTANSNKHNYSKRFKRYLKTRSTRSVRAILRTQRLDAAFFWMEFYPLVRDMWLRQNPQFTFREFEVLLQLHANQPFTIDDIYASTTMKRDVLQDDWDKKTSPGVRMAKDFIKRCVVFKLIRIRLNRGRYNKIMYELTPNAATDFRRIYEYMLCITKIPTTDTSIVDPIMKRSTAHYKKMIKQNTLKDAFDCELEREIKTTNQDFSIKLRRARIESR
jgi:hypothetical protein